MKERGAGRSWPMPAVQMNDGDIRTTSFLGLTRGK